MHTELLDTAVAASRLGAEIVTRYFRSAALDVRCKGENDFVTRADRESEAAIVAEIRRRHPGHRILAEESGASGGDGGGAGATGGDGDYEWLIDPLDGTTNFLQGLPVYCVSIACRRGGEVLAGVVNDPAGANLFAGTAGGGAFWNGARMETSRQPGLSGAFLATGYPFRAHATIDLYLAVFRDVFLQAKAVRRCGAAALDLAYTAAGVYDGFFEFRLSPWDIGAGVLLVREAGGRVTDLDGGQRFFRSGNVVAGGPAVQRELEAAVRRHAGEEALDRVSPLSRPELAAR
ncbi:MAG TPA: inositol monophosphatase family protein [Thermoanaerobaculia bacterium]|nr:inositol monophosphatase family protein [Thermoanaerobaculia bacterium]